MKTKLALGKVALAAALIALNSILPAAHAQGTAFTYQGLFQNGGVPANGNYDFSFSLFNTNSTNGEQMGNTIVDTNVGVTNGLFIVTLDFGPVFTGNPTWVAIGVRANGATNFTALNPLQPLTPTPYAVFAGNAGSAVSVTGPISATQLPMSVVTNGGTNINLSGSFSGDGGGLTNVAAATLATTPSSSNDLVPVQTLIFSTHGTNTFTVPTNIPNLQAQVKLWGAGGGTAGGYSVQYIGTWSGGTGGGGAYSSVTFPAGTVGTFEVVVGQSGGSGGGTGANDGSGGAGGTAYESGSPASNGARGGQASSLFLVSGTNYIMESVAGGGGGGGGAQEYLESGSPGNPGLSTGSGIGYATIATTTGETNLDLMGGAGGGGGNGDAPIGGAGGGGGGGGYGGGSGGGGGEAIYASAGGGGGGGSYGDLTIAGVGGVPGNTNDSDYMAPSGMANNDGLAVVIFGFSNVAAENEVIQANAFVGYGGLLTGLNSSQLTGTISPTNLVVTNTFTPTIGDSAHNFITSNQKGIYTQIGNLIYFESSLAWTNRGSAVLGSNLDISLPLPVAASQSQATFTLGYLSGINFDRQLISSANGGATNFQLYDLVPGNTPQVINVGNAAATGQIQVTGTYRWQ